MTDPIERFVEDDRNCIQRDHYKKNPRSSHKADHDTDFRFELFLLEDGQQKVETKEETRKQHAPPPASHPH